MKIVSEDFKERAENQFGTRYYTKIIVDGMKLTDTIEDFKSSSMTNPDEAFSFGNTCAASIAFSIIDPSINLAGKELEVYQGLKIGDNIEYVLLGKFTVLKPKNNKGTSSYKCYDRMVSKMESTYFSELNGVVTDIEVLQEICSQSEIELVNVDGLISHELSSIPTGYTKREVIGYLAQLQGKNAIINADGNLELIWYTETDYIIDDDRIYSNGTDEINDETDYTLGYIKCSVTNSDGTETVELTSGSGTIGINIENPFMTQEILDEVFEVIGGFSFRALEVEFLGDFRLEVGDIVTVNTNGNTYTVPIMQLEHNSDGGVVTVIKSVAETDEENQIDEKGPMLKQMERYYAELVLLNKAMINTLTVEQADLRYTRTEQLDAIEANIESAVIGTIDGKYATIEYVASTYTTTNQFDALSGRVGDLETNSLTADSGIIKDLESYITKTNTLIFGSASGTTIQTEFSNSVIAQLGNAQIKSAMIESVSASKVTAGDIITNNVRVMSEDGSLTIADETIQISDASRVRVQIGKDANSDYNMYVWDKSGNVMFDALGLTAAGITRQIIRDDMVSDNANISAGKLNIDSLFTEINNSSNTIKSTKIYLDDKGQTLDVAFLSMTTSVTTVTSTANSALSSATEANSKIDSLEIGGRNLFSNADFAKGTTGWGGSNGTTVSIEEIDGRTCLKVDPSTCSLSTGNGFHGAVTIEPAQKYTLSAKIYVEQDTQVVLNTWYVNSGWKPWRSSQRVNVTEGWNNVSLTFTTNETYTDYICGFQTPDKTTLIYVYHPQLEKGTMVTDFTIAPEDVEADISVAQSTADSAVASAATNAANISTITTTVTSQGTQISALQGQISSKIWQEDITTAVSSIEVGGRNLLLNTNKLYTRTCDNTDADANTISFLLPSNYDLQSLIGKKMVLSCWIKTPGEKQVNGNYGSEFNYRFGYYICILWKDSSGNLADKLVYPQINLNLSVDGQRRCDNIVITPPAGYDTIGTIKVNMEMYARPANTNPETWEIGYPKLELGNVATDWSLAPEDTEADITTLSTQYTELNQGLSNISAIVANHTTQIASKAESSTVTAVQSQVTSLQADLKGFKTTVSDTYATQTSLAAVDGKFADYSTTSEMNSAIEQKASSITTTVNSTYARRVYHTTNGTNGATGYFLLATITVTGTHVTMPIEIDVVSRGSQVATCYIRFSNTSSTDPTVLSFSKTGSLSFYLGKADTSTWKLYVRKEDAYDSLSVVGFPIGTYAANRCSVTWEITQVSSVSEFPSGYLTAKQLAALYTIDSTNGGTSGSNSLATSGALYSTTTIATQTAEKFNWIVASGTSASDFTITDRMASLTAQYINLNGLVTFSGLDTSTQSAINTANSTAASALTSATNANSKFDILEVGTRNLLTYTNQGVAGWGKSSQNGQITIEEVSALGKRGAKLTTTVVSSGWHIAVFSKINMPVLKKGGTYTLSFDVYPTAGITINVHYMAANATNSCGAWGVQTLVANEWNHYEKTLIFSSAVEPSINQVIYINGLNTLGEYTFVNMMLVEGTKSGSWTPAPEDVETDITAAQTTATTANTTAISALSTANSALSLANANDAAIANWCHTNDKTLIDGAKIYTHSITANEIDVTDLFAQDITVTGTFTGAILVSALNESVRVILGEATSDITSGAYRYKFDLEGLAIKSTDSSGNEMHIGAVTKNSFYYNTQGEQELLSGILSPYRPMALLSYGDIEIVDTTGGSYYHSYKLFSELDYLNEFWMACSFDDANVTIAKNLTAVAVTTMSGVDLDEVNSKLSWITLGTVTGGTNSLTIPSGVSEILVTVFVNSSSIQRIYQNIILGDQIDTTTPMVYFIGGYYASSADYGYCNVNLNSREISIRNFIYAGSNYITSAMMIVRYKRK